MLCLYEMFSQPRYICTFICFCVILCQYWVQHCMNESILLVCIVFFCPGVQVELVWASGSGYVSYATYLVCFWMISNGFPSWVNDDGLCIIVVSVHLRNSSAPNLALQSHLVSTSSDHTFTCPMDKSIVNIWSR